MVPPQERMKSALGVLRQKKDAFDKTKRNYEETVTCIQVKWHLEANAIIDHTFSPLTPGVLFQAQAQFVEQRTREEFDRLHAFLRAEEECRLQALRAEEEQRRRAAEEKIQDISRDIQSLSETITALEEDLALEGMPILHVSLDSGLNIQIKRHFLFSNGPGLPSGVQEGLSKVRSTLLYIFSLFELIRVKPKGIKL